MQLVVNQTVGKYGLVHETSVQCRHFPICWPGVCWYRQAGLGLV